MDPSAMVKEQIDEGRTTLTRLEDAGVEIAVAAWARRADDGEWLLFVVAPSIERDGGRHAATQLTKACGSFKTTWVTNAVRLLGPNDFRAQSLLRLRDRAPWVSPASLVPASLGDMEINGLYLYPARLRPDLTDADRRLLADLYARLNVSADQLAYSPEMDALHRDFVEQTNVPIAVGDLYRELLNLRKSGAPRRGTAPAEPSQSATGGAPEGPHAPSGTAAAGSI
jgi:hypothetical protein